MLSTLQDMLTEDKDAQVVANCMSVLQQVMDRLLPYNVLYFTSAIAERHALRGQLCLSEQGRILVSCAATRCDDNKGEYAGWRWSVSPAPAPSSYHC